MFIITNQKIFIKQNYKDVIREHIRTQKCLSLFLHKNLTLARISK